MLSPTTPSGNFGPTLEQRLTPSIARSKALQDVINQSLRVALPGIVQSFTPGPPATVTVLIATAELVTVNTAADPTGTQLVIGTQTTALPILQDVPIQIYGGGGWSVTTPIQAGDECMVVFCDTPIDRWLEIGNATKENPISQRRHSLSDGIAIFGLRSQPRALTAYSTTSMQLRNDGANVLIDLADDQITINAPTVTVNASSQANVTAANVVIQATSTIAIEGSAPFVHTTSIDGKSFLDHIHPAAAGFTGPVVVP